MQPVTFLKAFWNTFSRPSYYREIFAAPINFSIRFSVIASVLLAIFFALLFQVRTAPKLQAALEQNANQAADAFPPDLSIRWTGQELQSSKSPFSVQYPSDTPRQNLPSSFLLIDTSLLNLEHVEESNLEYLLVAGKNEMYIQNQAKQWQAFPYSEMPRFDQPWLLNKTNVKQWAEQAVSLASGILARSWLIYPFIWLPLFLFTRAISVVINAGIMWLLFRLSSPKLLKFSKIAQLMLHCIVVAEFANFFTELFYGPNQYPVANVIFWVYFAVAIWQTVGRRMVSIRSVG